MTTENYLPLAYLHAWEYCPRSSGLVAANIAESWRKRRYPAAFVSKLNDAESEAAETQAWIEIALRCGYLTPEEASFLDSRCEEVLGQLVAMISHPEQWTWRGFSRGRRKSACWRSCTVGFWRIRKGAICASLF